MASSETSTETGAGVATVPSSTSVSTRVVNGVTVIGVRNVTLHAGATTFIYLLKKELALTFGQDSVAAIEIEKNDFQLFNDKNMISCKANEIKSVMQRFPNASIILVDLNDCKDDTFCADVLYLLEPSTIKLNKLVRKNSSIFGQLMNKKIILNKSLLLNNDVFDFENEAGVKVFYNMPPLDERKRNAIINDFLSRLGLFQTTAQSSGNSNKIFGLFRR